MDQKSEYNEIIVRPDYTLTDLPNCDLVQFLFDRFKEWPKRTAIMCEKLNRSYTYKDLEINSLKWGAAIVDLSGGEAPNCVGIISPNVPEFPIAVLGALAVGCVVTAPGITYTPEDIAYQLTDAGASVLVFDTTVADKVEAALKVLAPGNRPKVIVCIGSTQHGYPDLLQIIKDENYKKIIPTKNLSSKTALLPYTSGTTGHKKGVCLPHGSLTNAIVAFVHPNYYPQWDEGKEHQESAIAVMPFYHSFGLFVNALTGLYLGTKIICLTDVTAVSYAEAIKKHNIRLLQMSPPFLTGLACSPLVTKDHLATVSVAMVAGASLHPTVALTFNQKTNGKVTILEGMGITETLGIMITPLSQACLGYCGKLLPNIEAKVVDIDTGKCLGPNTPGELLVKGPGFFSEYHNNPEATAKVLTPDGWFATGDVVQYTHDGFFSVIDRIKDMIKVDACQVSPTQVEEVIIQIEGVKEAAVIGIPNVAHGELPKAFVVLKEETQDQQTLDQFRCAINSMVEEKLMAHMKLRAGIQFVKEIPKNPTGKLMRRTLRETLLKKL